MDPSDSEVDPTSTEPLARRRRRRAQRDAGPAAPAGRADPPAAAPTPGASDTPAVEAQAPFGANAGDEVMAGTDRRQRRPPERAPRADGDGPKAVRTSRRANRDSERGWRDLAGNSPSQVGLSGALRARDLARPGPDELTAAEQHLVIVRRQWQPPDNDAR